MRLLCQYGDSFENPIEGMSYLLQVNALLFGPWKNTPVEHDAYTQRFDGVLSKPTAKLVQLMPQPLVSSPLTASASIFSAA
jgi:hypothetical protein